VAGLGPVSVRCCVSAGRAAGAGLRLGL